MERNATKKTGLIERVKKISAVYEEGWLFFVGLLQPKETYYEFL